LTPSEIELMIDDFSVPGAADAFGLWPSPWNYPAPGKKYVVAHILSAADKQTPIINSSIDNPKS